MQSIEKSDRQTKPEFDMTNLSSMAIPHHINKISRESLDANE